VTGIPHVQRCIVTRLFGEGRSMKAWQCKLPDPHPDRGHDFGVDAERFNRDLNTQRPEWLAAQLRDAVARERHLQRTVEQVQAAAIDLATGWAGGTGVSPETAAWVARNAPTAAELHGWT